MIRKRLAHLWLKLIRHRHYPATPIATDWRKTDEGYECIVVSRCRCGNRCAVIGGITHGALIKAKNQGYAKKQVELNCITSLNYGVPS